MTEPRRCPHIKSDGTRCGVTWGFYPDGLCLHHSTDPEAIQKREEGRKRGGENSKRPPEPQNRARTVSAKDLEDVPFPPQTLEDAVECLAWTSFATATGKIDGRTSHELSYALRAFLDGRKRVDDVDARVKELRAKMDQLRDDRQAGGLR